MSTKLEIFSFLPVFYQFSTSFSNAWAIGARPFCVAVCEGGARHKTGRKMEAPPARKLVENWTSETGRKLEYCIKTYTIKKKAVWHKYIYI